MKTLFKRTQTGNIIIIFFFLISTALMALIYYDDSRLYVLPIILVAAAIVVLLYNHTIELNKVQLQVTLGAGLIKKIYYIGDISSIDLVDRNSWYDWIYKYSKFQTVQLNMKDGRQILIGTDKPEKLYESINKLITN